MVKVCIASDHHGVEIKSKIIAYLLKKGYEVQDFGTNSEEMVDFPVYAKKVGKSVANKDNDFGVLICFTGIGMSMAANKVKGVRCARVVNKEDAYHTRTDNDANVVAFSSELPFDQICSILDTFFNTSFSTVERYRRRVEMLDD